MKTIFLFILVVVVTGAGGAPTPPHAQQVVATSEQQVTTQLWLDYVEEWVFRPKHLLELEVGPKTLISGGEYWGELTLTPAYEYTPNGRWDLVARTLFSWVQQTAKLSTFEIRPVLGFKVYVSTDRVARWIIRDFNRIEGRFIYYNEAGEWQDTYRYRNRLELQYALTANNIVADNMLYALVDAEIFVNLGKNGQLLDPQ